MRSEKGMRSFRHHLIWGALLASLLLATTQLWSVYHIHRQNQWLNQLAGGHDIALRDLPNAGPRVLLARAVYLRKKHQYDEALQMLSRIEEHRDIRLHAQSRYDLGNVYLSQAMDQIETGRLNQAVPLLTLAKQAYRQALTLDSRFWDAKYNLEVGMDLLPEFDRISPSEPDDDATKPSDLWTTVPGFPRGLP